MNNASDGSSIAIRYMHWYPDLLVWTLPPSGEIGRINFVLSLSLSLSQQILDDASYN